MGHRPPTERTSQSGGRPVPDCPSFGFEKRAHLGRCSSDPPQLLRLPHRGERLERHRLQLPDRLRGRDLGGASRQSRRSCCRGRHRRQPGLHPIGLCHRRLQHRSSDDRLTVVTGVTPCLAGRSVCDCHGTWLRGDVHLSGVEQMAEGKLGDHRSHHRASHDEPDHLSRDQPEQLCRRLVDGRRHRLPRR